jgi:RimJ/RimL family protein N-acetyltransferase
MTPDKTIPPQPQQIRTERLVLRRWREEDLEPFRAMNADPEVTRFFPGTLAAEQSDRTAHRLRDYADTPGLGAWAVEIPGKAPFIGFAGCWPTRPELPFAPAIEIGWRIAKPYWGRGFAPEAARASLADAFERAGVDQVLAYATHANEPSLQVMRKIGMTYSPGEDFGHPMFEEGHPLQRHVVYRITADQFRGAQAA